MSQQNYYVVVVKGDPSHPEDADVPGRYEIGVDTTVPEKAARAVVLDCFHDKIGIEVLEDFRIQVEDADGYGIAEVEDYPHEFEGGATFYGKVDEPEPEGKASTPAM